MLGVCARAFFTTYVLEEEYPIKSGSKYPDIDYESTRLVECAAQILRLTEVFPAYYVPASSPGKCFAAFFLHESPLYMQFHELQRLRGVDFVIKAGSYACSSIGALIFIIPLALIATAVKIALFIFDQDRRNRYWVVVNYLKPKPQNESDFSGKFPRPLSSLCSSEIPEEIFEKVCQGLDFVALIRLSCTSRVHHVYFTTIFASKLKQTWELPPREAIPDVALVKQAYRLIQGECSPQVLEFLKFKNLVKMSLISSETHFENQMGGSPMACTRRFDFFTFRCKRVDTNELGFVTFKLKDMARDYIDWVQWDSGPQGKATICTSGVSLNKDELRTFMRGETTTFSIHHLMINHLTNPTAAVPLQIIHPLVI